MGKIKLKELVSYSARRGNSKELDIKTYITTDNLLQNKKGVTTASSLPPNGESFPKYGIDDILVSNIRPYLKKIWFADREGICSSDVLVFSVQKNHLPKFVYYSLFRDEFFEHSMKGAKGTKMPRGDKNQLLEFEIPYFTLSTQSKIAGILSTIDNKITLNNAINDNLERMAKTIYEYWFVQFDFPDAKGKPYKSSGGKMVWNEELKREVPEGWRAKSLNEIADIIGGSTPPREIESYFTNAGIAWITPKDLSLNSGNKFIKKGELDITESGKNSSSLNIMPRGTVLMSSRAPIGYLAITRNEVTTNQGFKSFVPKLYFSTEFIYYTIQNLLPVIENNASGSTFKEVSGSVIKMIHAISPNKEIIELYTTSVGAIFKRQELIEEENQQLASLRDWLLPMLMNGQVKVK